MLRTDIRLCLVPLWLDKILKTNKCSVTTLLDKEKMSEMLVEEDLNFFYDNHYKAIEQLLGVDVTNSFVHFHHINALEVNLEKYLLGNAVDVSGKDFKFVFSSVDGTYFIIMRESGGTVEDIVDDLMCQLETLYGIRKVSTLPIFKQFLNDIV